MDYIEKYVRLNIDFPNKAGKLAQVLATQKRLIEALVRSKPDPKVIELIQIVAEGYDVSQDLLQYMRATLQEVADDSVTLRDGAHMRDVMKFQGELIQEYMDADQRELDKIKARRDAAREEFTRKG